MKKGKKLLVVFALLSLLVTIFLPVTSAEAASSATVSLGGGWKVRIDRPHDNKTGKWHGHVYDNKGREIGAENVDGTKHDGKTFKNVPKKKLETLKNSKKWKEAKDKNSKMVLQRNKLTFTKFLIWLAKNTVISNI